MVIPFLGFSQESTVSCPPDYEEYICNESPLKILVCHNGMTKCVSINAVESHLAHGDTLGECQTLGVEDRELQPDNLIIGDILTVNKAVRLTIYDYMGKVLLTDTSSKLNVSELTSGVYIVLAENENKRATYKIIKK